MNFYYHVIGWLPSVRSITLRRIFMRIQLVLISFFLLILQLQAYESKAQRVTLIANHTSLEDVLKQFVDQTSYDFLYNPELLKKYSVPVTIERKNSTMEEALTKIFDNQPNLSYAIDQKTVIIRPKKGNSETTHPTDIKQVLEIKGRIIDSKGEPLPGASVKVKGTATGTVANANGYFSLKSVDSRAILVVSYTGFISQEIPVNGRKEIAVSLVEDRQSLKELVVIGYGTQQKMDLTGSVSQIDMQDVNLAPVSSFTEALAGRAAGVQVSSNDGQPGESQQIIIRGAGSLTQDNAPLYVVDGFPLEDFQVSSLNPNDIESITILKDASATAIYGARAANGVVVVETKKGKVGKPTIEINSSLGFQDIRKQMDLMSPYEFVKYQSEINPVHANTFYFQDGKTLESYRDVEGINWQDEVFRTALTQIHNISLRGGVNQTKYSLSGSIFDQNSVIINTGFKRNQGRISIDQGISKKLKVGFIANFSETNSFGIPASTSTGTNDVSNYLFYNTWGYRPVTGDDTNLLTEEVDEDIIDANQIRINPVLTAENTYRKNIVKNLSANFYTWYNITDDLTFKLTAGTSRRDTRNEAFNNSLTPQGSPQNIANSRGINGSISFFGINNWSNENILTYNKTINKHHKINLLAGFSLQSTARDGYGYSAQLLPNEELGIPGFDEGTPSSLTAQDSKSTLASFFNRLNYNYKSKYLFTATFRGDGSSKFSVGNRWGYFPSGAFAWNMVKENFMKPLRFVSNSKLRLSYGLTGNNRVGDFSYLPGINLPANVTVSFDNATPSKALVFNGLGNQNLKWETTTQVDIGYDLGLLNEKIQLTLDVYRKTTDDLLLNALIPYTTGFSSAFKNIGKVRNEGLEIELRTINIKKPAFSWESSFNISFNRSEVLELTEGQNKLFSNVNFSSFYANSPLWVAEIGKPVASFHGFIFDGVYQFEDFDNPSPGTYLLKNEIPTNGNPRQSIMPGDIKYKDLNNDGIVNTLDQTIIGRAIPIHIGGFSNNFSYKGFLLNVFLQWSYGNKIYNANRLLLDGNGLLYRSLNQYASYENRWTPENPSNEYFRAGGQGPFGVNSSRVLEDGSYLRLKTISLGYQVPKKYIQQFYLNSLTLHASAQNLLTWTNYSGMDPEVSVRNSALTPGFDYSAYPHAQTIVFGLKASF